MNYDLSKLEYVKAIKIKGHHKTDVQVQVKIIIKLKDEIDVQNISVKLVSNDKGFNQIDKRRIKNYQALRNIPGDVVRVLWYFCGEYPPYRQDTKDKRRMMLNEMTQEEQKILLQFLEANRLLVISDIIK